MRKSGNSNDEVIEQLRALSRQIEAVKHEILNAISAQEFRELKGTVNGLVLTFLTYDGVPKDEPRLRELIDEGAIVHGRLAEALASIAPNEDRHWGGLDVLLTLIFLRAIAMYEREWRFRVPEIKDIPLMFPEAVRELLRALENLRSATNLRVRGPYNKRERLSDTIDVGYTIDGTWQLVDSVLDELIEKGIHESLGPALKATRLAMDAKKTELFDTNEYKKYWDALVQYFTQSEELGRIPPRPK